MAGPRGSSSDGTAAARVTFAARPLARTGARLATLAMLALAPALPAAAQSGLGGALELVDPATLRVCADPRNMPFSNDAGEGFENALARFVADKLGKGLAYTYFPQGVGFVRNTLAANRCDVIMGYAQGDELVQNTNPYYRTSWALVVPENSPLAAATSLSDPLLQGSRLGVVAGTPPATTLARAGLMKTAHAYALMVDTRASSPVADMFSDLQSGAIDGALAWGPMAGWFAKSATVPLKLIPLVHETGGSRMTYRITMGVRPSDQEWKRTLNDLIREHQGEIDKILASYGVPLLDENDRPVMTPGG